MESEDFFIDGKVGRLSVRAVEAYVSDAPTIVLVQGATLSGQTAFDLRHGDYSLMAALKAKGFSSVTFAVRGYGKSELTGDPLSVDTEAAMEDLDVVVRRRRERDGRPVHLLGWSWGARIAARYTEDHADSIDRLVLLNPALGGGPRVPFDGKEPWFSASASSLGQRLPLALTEPTTREAFVALALRDDSRSPSGIRAENARGSQPANALAIARPTLLISGGDAEHREVLTGADTYGGFVEKLQSSDKALVAIPGSDHYGHLQCVRRAYHSVITSFLRAYDLGG